VSQEGLRSMEFAIVLILYHFPYSWSRAGHFP